MTCISRESEEENENEWRGDGIGQWYTDLCVAHRLEASQSGIRKGAIVELKRPTASGTYRVFIDNINGQTMQYSYGLGLLSEGSCRLSDIRKVMPENSFL